MSRKSKNVIIDKIENKINNFGILSESKNKSMGEKRQMYTDTCSQQNINQWATYKI